MTRLFLTALVSAGTLLAGTATELARQIVDAGLDPNECYRVRDLHFTADRAKFFFADGYLILGRAVEGHRLTAFFTTDVEGGDAEVLLLPPNRAERRSLAGYAGSPNLDEHFTTTFMLFSPEILDQFMEQIRTAGARKSVEMGALLDSKYSPTARNITANYDVRLTWMLLSPEANRGFFSALVSGRTAGNFDVIYDPLAAEQMTVGSTSFRDNQTVFDTWTSFAARDNPPPPPQAKLSGYRIEAKLDPDLLLNVVTRYRYQPVERSTAVPFDISGLMNVTEARIDGVPAEVLQRDDMRMRILRDTNTELALAVAQSPVEPGRDHEIEIHHSGHVILDAGHQVYYVQSRGNWYPAWGPTYTTYDVIFRGPKNLHVVLPGQPVNETIDGEERVVHHRIDTPIRIAGFNLGVFEKTTVTRSGFTIDVYANHEFENAIQPRTPVILPEPSGPTIAQRRGRVPMTVPAEVITHPAPPPAARLQSLADSVAGAMGYFTTLFGPPPLRRLEVTPLPGTIGQGFPGLIYISTISYLVRADVDPRKRVFFDDLLQPHEAAHQWWGNLVSAGGYHDEWITESLANYSALLYLDKLRGSRRESERILASYRDQLVAGDVEETGPIVQGRRLETAPKRDAWRAITYGKGTWIIHMLRARMGDAAFFKMLAAVRREFEDKAISTEQFRLICAKFLPAGSADPQLENFFDQWVYSTGIPQLRLTWSSKPGRVSGTITQSGVKDEMSLDVPVEIRVGARVIRKTVRSDAAESPFSFAVAGGVTKVMLDPDNTILRRP